MYAPNSQAPKYIKQMELFLCIYTEMATGTCLYPHRYLNLRIPKYIIKYYFHINYAHPPVNFKSSLDYL